LLILVCIIGIYNIASNPNLISSKILGGKKMKKKYNTMYSFYILDSIGEEYYYTGEGFTMDIEEGMIYFADLSPEYIKANYLESPIAKQILKEFTDLKPEDLKIDL
jgi:hypothetical protein